MTHTIEESLEEILKRLDNMSECMEIIAGYFDEKYKVEFNG